MAWTFCTIGEATAKAGVNVNSDVVNYTTNSTNMDAISNQVEGSIEVQTGKAFLDNYSDLPTGIKGALARCASSMIAMDFISQDTRGYLTREADTLMNQLDGTYKESLRVLKEYTKLKLRDPTG